MSQSWICRAGNLSRKDVYDRLHKLILTESQLKTNDYPSRNRNSKHLVPDNCPFRTCIRCGATFEVYEGLHLSLTHCVYHPKKAVLDPRSRTKRHQCCNRRTFEKGCTPYKYHVTMQHGTKVFTPSPPNRCPITDYRGAILSLDCEMSYTTSGLEVTRIGVVDLLGTTRLDWFIKPKNLILDYNTQYSGVEKRHLDHVTVTIDDVQEKLSSIILEDTILIGHGLNNDLAALGFIHNTVVDTSVLYADGNKKSLKALAADHLDWCIQDGASGHNCIEDAKASLLLALLKVSALCIPPAKMGQSPTNCGYFHAPYWFYR